METQFPWHKPTLTRLEQLLDAETLPHAIALTCEEGWGLLDLLQRACELLLDQPAIDTLADFAHPDFRWVTPDGAQIKIDQIRRVNDFAVQTVQSAPRKVIAIEDAHCLNPAAANALLKTLEEPPPNTHVLLATSRWGKLLPTIRSRSQRLVSAPDQDAARTWLGEQDIELSDLAYAECGYAPLSAAQALRAENAVLEQWVDLIGSADYRSAVDGVLDGDITSLLRRWYRRLILHLGGTPLSSVSASQTELMLFCDLLVAARRQLETTNSSNAKSLVEQLVYQWQRLCR